MDYKLQQVCKDQQGTVAALVVIDPDTVMPGPVGHDFGKAMNL